MSFNGFILVDKSEDWTSRDVCNKLSKVFHTKKVGHIGTLDPFATGLLIVAFGEGTKCLPYISDDNKTYIATLKLGVETSTGDLTGEEISTKEVPALEKDKIVDVLSSFIGEQDQIPPMTSAIHHNGQKLYELFRQGITVEIEPKRINIFDIRLISYDENSITFAASVSKGTYIRVLGEDIAKRLGTVGHLVSLRRTKINDICVEKATKMEDITENSFISFKDMMSHFIKSVTVNKVVENKARHGMDIYLKEEDENILLIDEQGMPIAFYGKIKEGNYRCLRGFNFENN